MTEISQDPFFLKNWSEFFFLKKIFFQELGTFFATAKSLIWVLFSSEKIYFFSFFQVWLFNFNLRLKTRFKNSFRKSVKK